MIKKILPLRTGVGIVVLNKDNQVFVGKRRDNPGDKWQMPQGGVDKIKRRDCTIASCPLQRNTRAMRFLQA